MEIKLPTTTYQITIFICYNLFTNLSHKIVFETDSQKGEFMKSSKITAHLAQQSNKIIALILAFSITRAALADNLTNASCKLIQVCSDCQGPTRDEYSRNCKIIHALSGILISDENVRCSITYCGIDYHRCSGSLAFSKCLDSSK